MPVLFVDLLFFNGKQGGTETVAREIYSRMPSDGSWAYVGYASTELAREGAPWFPGKLIDSGLRIESRPQWAWGELTRVARAARAIRADLIHSPANFGPRRTAVPLVLTLHDVLAFRRPEFLPTRTGAVPTRLLQAGAARAARHIITVSEVARRDITEVLGIPPERISVIRPGTETSGRATPVNLREQRHLFSLGNRMPHKNFPRLIEALARIPADRRPRITISGSHGDDPLRPLVQRAGLEEWIDLRGWIDSVELERLYQTCTAVVFPTLYEGFGLPVVEAMTRGCPVICSDIPVLREVGGNAARYFDPEDVGSIARAIDESLQDTAGLAALHSAGLLRAQEYDWNDAAAATLEVFKTAVAEQ